MQVENYPINKLASKQLPGIGIIIYHHFFFSREVRKHLFVNYLNTYACVYKCSPLSCKNAFPVLGTLWPILPTLDPRRPHLATDCSSRFSGQRISISIESAGRFGQWLMTDLATGFLCYRVAFFRPFHSFLFRKKKNEAPSARYWAC